MSASATDTTPNPSPVSFREALRYWLRLGFISFGGPAGQIAIMHQDLVERRRWISEHRFLHALNFCMLLPGPEAQQLATYIGWLLHGAKGGIAAGALFVLPSLFILTALTWVYLAFGDVPAVAGVLYGVKPAVVAIVLFAAYRIGARALRNAVLVGVAVTAFVAIYVFDVPFPYIVLGAGMVGLLGGRMAPALFKADSHSAGAGNRYGAALIDDHSPLPAHAAFKWTRAAAYGGVGVALWAITESALCTIYGWDGVLPQIGWFFTKAALLTFGGAYAVLPYVYKGAVEHYEWLTATQMIDGLALGETTPGPLIMIVTFVGFVGGWTKELFGADALGLAGIAGAVTATFFTFLPSFVFVLVGAPAIEATRHDLKFTAPLAAITAAVVGVILSLALFFAYHVLWPDEAGTAFDWFSAVIGAIAFVALWRCKIGVVTVIAACGVAGLIYTLLLKQLFPLSP
jgi:chromate transporter